MIDEKDIKTICDKVLDKYSSRLANDNSTTKLIKEIYRINAKMICDILIEYNNLDKQ